MTAVEEVWIGTTTAPSSSSSRPGHAILADRVESAVATTTNTTDTRREAVAPKVLVAATTTARVVDLRARDREG